MLLVLALVLLLLSAAAPASGATLSTKYLQHCTLANQGQIDPLVNPGGVADHYHDEFGATVWNADSTTGDMLSGATTCNNTSNKSAYWVPAIEQPDGTLVHAYMASGYYSSGGADTAQIAGGRIEPFPVGIRMIIGDSKSAGPQSKFVTSWSCNHVAGGVTFTSGIPATCDGYITLGFYGPTCWDGMNLDTANHRDHVKHVATSTGNVSPGCPASHPIRIPRLEWGFRYPKEAAGGMLTSDHGVGPAGRTAHMDLWEAQDPMHQATLTACLNDPAHSQPSSVVACGIFGGTGNPLNASLAAWTDKVQYVDPTGHATPPAP